MTVNIYAFGSICRGDLKSDSDIDLLVLAKEDFEKYDRNKFSIYTFERISDIWKEGNPFAWHLHLESQMIYSSNGKDFLKTLGLPSQYKRCYEDCVKFFRIIMEAEDSLKKNSSSSVFDLSTIFLGIRNIATCYSLRHLDTPTFERDSALKIGDLSINIDTNIYNIFKRARIISIRGYGEPLTASEVSQAFTKIADIKMWAANIVRRAGES